MKRMSVVIGLIASVVCGQDAIPPPVIVTPPITGSVSVVVNQVVTNQVVVQVPIVITNATLTQFTVYIDENQAPVRFLSRFSDGSYMVTMAAGVGSLTNRAALNVFNGLLQEVVGGGQRVVPATPNRLTIQQSLGR